MMRVLSCEMKPSNGVGENMNHTLRQDLWSQDHVLLQLLETIGKVDKHRHSSASTSSNDSSTVSAGVGNVCGICGVNSPSSVRTTSKTSADEAGSIMLAKSSCHWRRMVPG
eukprot:1763844-Amphidinium_carterae.1